VLLYVPARHGAGQALQSPTSRPYSAGQAFQPPPPAQATAHSLTDGQVQDLAGPHNGEQAVNVVKDVLEHLILCAGGRLQYPCTHTDTDTGQHTQRATHTETQPSTYSQQLLCVSHNRKRTSGSHMQRCPVLCCCMSRLLPPPLPLLLPLHVTAASTTVVFQWLLMASQLQEPCKHVAVWWGSGCCQ
jgi:hypothetical protein